MDVIYISCLWKYDTNDSMLDYYQDATVIIILQTIGATRNICHLQLYIRYI